VDKPYLVEEGVYRVQLILPDSLEHARLELELCLLKAQKRIVNFARLHEWRDLIQGSFYDLAEIYDTKASFDKTLTKLSEPAAQIEIPVTYSAALENRRLMAVSPELYSCNYPEGVEQDSYEKLLAHEIAHRLHIRILNGDENLMGPIWFFEGFAIYAVDQFSQDIAELEPREIRSIILNPARTSYRKYGSLFRYFVKKSSVTELIEQSEKPDFEKWLQQCF
jgi:hypothetical protein